MIGRAGFVPLGPFLLLAATAAVGHAQEKGPGAITPLASLRIRSETMNWFGDAPGGQYTFFGATARLGLEQQLLRRRVGSGEGRQAGLWLGHPAWTVGGGAR